MNEVLHALHASELLFRYERYVNCALELHFGALEVSQSSEVLHPDAFHVLRAPREDSPLVVDIRRKRLVRPKLLENGYNVHV